MNVEDNYYLVIHRGKPKWYSKRDPVLERWLYRNAAHIELIFTFGVESKS